jgi:hypothetical protein
MRKLRRGELLYGFEGRNAGIVDEDIQTAEVLHGVRYHAFDRRLIGDIRLHDHTASPQCLDLLLGLCGPLHGQASNEEVCTFLGHGHRDGLADSAQASRDYCHFPF